MWSSVPYLFMCMFLLFFGTTLTISSSHWLSIWAGFELNLMGFLPLIIYARHPLESESSVKYFIMQALGSALLLLGSLYSFNLTYSWDFMDMVAAKSMSVFVVMSSLMIKMGAFPFYYWVPSVMAGLSWIACLILLTWQKVAPLFAMSMLFALQADYFLNELVCFTAIGSTLAGGMGGVNQSQLRALIAYSSIGHLGWMLFSLLMSSWLTVLYFLIYACVSITLFLPMVKLNFSSMKFFSGLYSNLRLLVGIFIGLMSLGAVPPLLGFMGKWVIILHCINSIYFMTLIILILGSLFSLFYYLSFGFIVAMNLSLNQRLSTGLFSRSLFNWFSLVINFLGGFMLLILNMFY